MISTQAWLAIRAKSVVTFSALFILGCASEEESWKNAKEADSAEGYSAFVDDFPDGRYSGLAHWRLQESVRSLHIEAFQLLKGSEDAYSAPSAIYAEILRIDPDNAHALNNMAFIVLASELDNDIPYGEQMAVIEKARRLTERAFESANRREVSQEVRIRAFDGWHFFALQVADYDKQPSSLRGMVGENLKQLGKPLGESFEFPDFPLAALIIHGKLINKNGEPLANRELWLLPTILQEDDVAGTFSLSQSNYFDKAGNLLGLSTTTDNAGSFEFTIDDAAERTLKPYTGTTMGVYAGRYERGSLESPSQAIFKLDVPFVFQPDPDAEAMELGELTLRAPKRDSEIPPPGKDSETSSAATTEITEEQRREEILRQVNADAIEAKRKRTELDTSESRADCSGYTDAAELAAKTPEQLFRSILARAINRCYDEIRPLVVTIPGDERMRDAGYRDSWDLAIEMFKTQAYPSNGDFAYSNAGLEVLIEQHLDKFGRMPAEYHSRLQQEEPYASVADVQEALENDPDGFLVMTHNGVNVVVVRVRGKYRLLFWEHLPKLAGGRRQLE